MRETALALVKTTLDSLSGWGVVRRNWSGRIARAECPAAVLFDGGEDAQDYRTGKLQVEIPIEIDLAVATDAHDTLGPEFSARLAEIKALLMADETLGGQVIRIRYQGCDDPVDDDELGGSPMRFATVRFDLLIEHGETTPYS